MDKTGTKEKGVGVPVRGKVLRRTAAGLLALTGLWLALGPAVPAASWGNGALPFRQRVLLGDSALLAQWMSERDRPDIALGESAQPPQEAAPPPAPSPVREETLSGGAGYLSGGGVDLFNRTERPVDLEAVAQGGTAFRLQPADRGPQILIMHTHTTESYAMPPEAPYTETGEAHTTDTAYNIVQVGNAITQTLTEMGFSVLHDTQVYDWPSYNGAYERSRAGTEAILAEHPTIGMVLDVHRDAMVDGTGTVCKPVTTADGDKIAQVMLLVGTDAGGGDFPDWQEHLALAMEITREMNALWPGLARPITLRTARFNQQLTPGSLLVEVGSHGNTLEEAVAGGRLFARALGRVLEGYVRAE